MSNRSRTENISKNHLEKIFNTSIKGQIWSEGMRNVEMLLSNVFPRLIALAEVGLRERSFENLDLLGLDILNDPSFVAEWTNFRDNKLNPLVQEILADYPNFPFRIPVPGSKVVNGKLMVVNEQNLEMQYRNDGWKDIINNYGWKDFISNEVKAEGEIELRTKLGNQFSRIQKVTFSSEVSFSLSTMLIIFQLIK